MAIEHGNYSKYVNDACRCEACTTAFREYAREYKKKHPIQSELAKERERLKRNRHNPEYSKKMIDKYQGMIDKAGNDYIQAYQKYEGKYQTYTDQIAAIREKIAAEGDRLHKVELSTERKIERLRKQVEAHKRDIEKMEGKKEVDADNGHDGTNS